MAGNREGALKAAKTNKEKHGEDFYKKIGAMSWDNYRSHKTGFALLPKEKHIEVSRKGGQKTKKDYQSSKEQTTTATSETSQDSTGVSE